MLFVSRQSSDDSTPPQTDEMQLKLMDYGKYFDMGSFSFNEKSLMEKAKKPQKM